VIFPAPGNVVLFSAERSARALGDPGNHDRAEQSLHDENNTAVIQLPYVKEPDLHPALSGDGAYTPSPRRSEG